MSAAALDTRERRALALARGAAAVSLFGTFLLPTLANLAAFVMLVSFAFLPSAGARLQRVLATPLARAALLMLAVMAAAMFWSDADWMLRFRAWFGWRTLVLMIVCLALFDEAQARVRVALAFIAVAAIGAAFSFWAWSQGFSTTMNNHGLNGIVHRNPVTQGIAFALAVFLAVLLAVTQRQLSARLRGALVFAAVLVFANLVFVTSGRSGHLLLLIMFAVVALQRLRRWQRAAALLALPLIAMAAYAASPMLQNRFGMMVQELRAPLDSERLSAMGIRTVMWRVSAQMVRERPLIGYGMAGFASAYAQAIKRSSYTGWAATPTEDPHNQYLLMQLQAGVAGTASFFWFLLACIRQRAAQPYRAWALAILAGWCASSLATSLFGTFAEGHMLMLLLGILLATGPEEGSPRSPATT